MDMPHELLSGTKMQQVYHPQFSSQANEYNALLQSNISESKDSNLPHWKRLWDSIIRKTKRRRDKN